MTTPEISVIIPVYNSQNYLRRCINSVLAQTFTNFECILVDDCSTDESKKICDEYTQKDSRIRVIHKKNNEGTWLAFKTGFDISKGIYILNVDNDDWIDREMLFKMYSKITISNYDIVYCNYFEEGFIEDVVTIRKHQYVITDKDILLKRCACMMSDSALWFKLIKRDIFNLVSFNAPNTGGDRFIMTQILFYANKIAYIDEELYHYCYNPKSITFDKSKAERQIKDNYLCYILICNFLKEKFANEMNQFEPELSNYVNSLKMLKLKKTHRVLDKELMGLYPESKFLHYLIKKTIKAVVPKKVLALRFLLKKIH